jgi:hypothetical protein
MSIIRWAFRNTVALFSAPRNIMKNQHIVRVITCLLPFLIGACGGEKDLPRAYDYIRATPAELVIELDTVSAFAPTDQTRTRLGEILSGVLDKPDGVRVDAHNFLDARGSDYVWTEAALLTLAQENFDLPVGDGIIKMHTLFVDGSFIGDTNTERRFSLRLGDTHLAIFIESIDEACNGGVNQALPKSDRDALCAVSTLAAWLHGTGHLLGLVNDGLPMVGNHEDLTTAGHDANLNCVMHHTFEGLDLIVHYRDRVLAGNTEVISFDSACVSDLDAAKTGD